MSFADQKAKTTPHPKGWNFGFWSQCHMLIKRWRQPPSIKLELTFLKSVSFADQKAKTTPHPKGWNFGFWSQCHMLIKRWGPLQKCRRCSLPRWRHHNIYGWDLGFGSQCHLLIKWGRQSAIQNVGTWVSAKVETPSHLKLGLRFWSQCPLLSKGRDNPHPISWNLGFWS